MNTFKLYLNNVPGLDSEWQLPINPENNFVVNIGNKFERVDVFGLGEVIVKKNKTLQSFSWSSFLPGTSEIVKVMNDIDNYEADPIGQANALSNAENAKVNLIINIFKDGREETFIDLDVIISSFKTEVRGGNIDDIFYSIELVEYKEAQVTSAPIPYNDTEDNQIFGFSNTDASGTTKVYDKGKENKSNTNTIGIGTVVIVTGTPYKASSVQKQYVVDQDCGGYETTTKTSTNNKEGVEREVKEYKPYLQNQIGTVKKEDDNVRLNYSSNFDTNLYQILLAKPITSTGVIDVLGSSIRNFGFNVVASLLGKKYKKDKVETRKISYVWVKKEDCKKFNGNISSRGI